MATFKYTSNGNISVLKEQMKGWNERIDQAKSVLGHNIHVNASANLHSEPASFCVDAEANSTRPIVIFRHLVEPRDQENLKITVQFQPNNDQRYMQSWALRGRLMMAESGHDIAIDQTKSHQFVAHVPTVEAQHLFLLANDERWIHQAVMTGRNVKLPTLDDVTKQWKQGIRQLNFNFR